MAPHPHLTLACVALQTALGDLWEMYIPSELGYGSRGSPPKIGADNVLVFKMEILGINGATKPAISCNVATLEDCDEKEKA